MNNEEAKKILALYRPGTDDRKDPEFAAALEMAGREGELAQWFREHRASYHDLRGKFQQIPVPAGLQGQIVAEYKIRILPPPERAVPMWRWAAALAAILCLTLIVWHWHESGAAGGGFAAYQNRMARAALQLYDMELASHDLNVIDRFLAGKNAPVDDHLSPGLAAAQPVGCVVLKWQGEPVSMLCFRSGRPLAPGQKADLWLFVIDHSFGVTPEGAPAMIGPVTKLTTATWERGGKTYILAASGDGEFLKKYLL